jgi:hypothetical protein
LVSCAKKNLATLCSSWKILFSSYLRRPLISKCRPQEWTDVHGMENNARGSAATRNKNPSFIYSPFLVCGTYVSLVYTNSKSRSKNW